MNKTDINSNQAMGLNGIKPLGTQVDRIFYFNCVL